MGLFDLGGSSAGDGADATPAQQVVDEIAAKGGRAVANYDSVSSWTGAEAMIQQAVAEFGGLDVLVNNAGILRDKMSFNMDEAEWDRRAEAPVRAALWTAQAAYPHLRQRDGRLILVCPTVALEGAAGLVPFASAAEAQRQLAKSAARRWGAEGITVNVVCPAVAALAPALAGTDADRVTASLPDGDDPLAGVTVPVAGARNPDEDRPSHLQEVQAELVSRLPVPDGGNGVDPTMPVLKTNSDYRAYIRSRTAAWKASRKSRATAAES